jgi:hypothetical protein
MGGGACLGGSTANCVIEVAEIVYLHRSTIFQALFTVVLPVALDYF